MSIFLDLSPVWSERGGRVGLPSVNKNDIYSLGPSSVLSTRWLYRRFYTFYICLASLATYLYVAVGGVCFVAAAVSLATRCDGSMGRWIRGSFGPVQSGPQVPGFHSSRVPHPPHGYYKSMKSYVGAVFCLNGHPCKSCGCRASETKFKFRKRLFISLRITL